MYFPCLTSNGDFPWCDQPVPLHLIHIHKKHDPRHPRENVDVGSESAVPVYA